MSDEAAAGDLRSQLDLLAARGQSRVREQRARQALSEGIRDCPRWFVAVPAAALVVQLHRLSLDSGSLGLGLFELLVGAVIPPGVLVLSRWVRAAALPVSRREGLAAIDAELVEADRFLAADEFSRAQSPSGFMIAAIEEAGARVEAALAQSPRIDRRSFQLPMRAVKSVVVALALLLLAALLDRVGTDGSSAGVLADLTARWQPESARRSDGPEEPTPQPADEIEPPSIRPSGDPRDEASRDASSDTSELSERSKESFGRTREGRSSDARSSSRGSDAGGAPSQQGQASKGKEEKPAPQSAKPPRPRQPRDSELLEIKNEDPAGSTAGRGSSRGSNKNPVTSDWSSRDQVSTPDDAEIEQDDDTEDEEEEQESRGGMQPNLRDRRPPVSRDLRIGFGNQPNPDANGRGGPSAAKKSRGVASLVLGVPIPDRVKGQPNAGRTKVTQERIQPRKEQSAPGTAEPRSPRDAPFGMIRDPSMSPWLREVVRRFFLEQRRRDASNTENPR